MRWWKVLGLAGVAGVAATGVVVARAERQRRVYTPDEVRAKLRARLDTLDPVSATQPATEPATEPATHQAAVEPAESSDRR